MVWVLHVLSLIYRSDVVPVECPLGDVEVILVVLSSGPRNY